MWRLIIKNYAKENTFLDLLGVFMYVDNYKLELYIKGHVCRNI